jgi:2-amino-4-hydroxy-6-hydroxymethyldihydropteridine diphosphokinase
VSEATIGLGSNLGDRIANLRAALSLIEQSGPEVIRRSSVWESAPVPPDQPAFLNAAAVLNTDHTPETLLDLLKEVEVTLGRRPGRRWGPRPVDLDVLFFDGLVVEGQQLRIPHPLIGERAFVLAPLLEVMNGDSERFHWALERLKGVGTAGINRTGLVL